MISKRTRSFGFVFFVITMAFISGSLAQTGSGSITVLWSPNQEADLAGYRLYYGFQSRYYTHTIDVGNRNEWTLRHLQPGKMYFVALTAYDLSGNESAYSDEVSSVPDTAQGSEAIVPDVMILYQNYPNPFYPSTTIPFKLTEDGTIKLRILNPVGQTVRVLYQGEQKAGFHKIDWDGKDESGNEIASGVYFIRLEAGALQLTKTMIIFR